MTAYHGTRRPETLELIIQGGFIRGTYFAHDVQHAILHGGDYVFAVEFAEYPGCWKGEPDGWQFWIRDPIGPECILWWARIRRKV